MEQDSIISLNNLPQAIDFKEGKMLLIDKPLEWTSFDVVNKVRFAIRHKFGLKKIKVGHAGTLDPLASGLLIICTGKYTKKISDIADADKCYIGDMKFGAETNTYDAEGEEINLKNTNNLSEEIIQDLIPKFSGFQMQMPPIYSAIKIKGQAAYKYARRGQDVVMKARPITINSLKFLDITLPNAKFEACCTKGTYIRSLAHDMGQALDCGAYLTGLVRTSIGEYSNENALPLPKIIDWIQSLELPECQ